MHGDFHTVGDVAYRDEEGYYYICDRKNDMIISGGMNVYPAEIEAALEQHPGIFDVAVFGIPPSNGVSRCVPPWCSLRERR
jgi:fatty-acyl-CoA synthase/long-chain acyl-CoA synthetase